MEISGRAKRKPIYPQQLRWQQVKFPWRESSQRNLVRQTNVGGYEQNGYRFGRSARLRWAAPLLLRFFPWGGSCPAPFGGQVTKEMEEGEKGGSVCWGEMGRDRRWFLTSRSPSGQNC